jgi:hypothetical protein
VVYPLVTLSPTSNAYPAGRHLGNPSGLTAVDNDLLPSNIIYGVQIFGVSGTHGYYDRWLQAWLSSTKTAEIKVPEQLDTEPAPIASENKLSVGDAPPDMIKQLTPAPTATDTAAIAVPDQTADITETPSSQIALDKVVDGAVADDGGAQTDETAAAQNDTANDMTLLPATPASDDAYYFGGDYVWDSLLLNIGTQGAGTWTMTWEYYDVDTTWHALGVTTDGILGFKAATGIKELLFTPDANWTTVAIAGITKYWIRARVSAYTSVTTQPKGTKAWCRIIL